jgi:hypothetical protein
VMPNVFLNSTTDSGFVAFTFCASIEDTSQQGQHAAAALKGVSAACLIVQRAGLTLEIRRQEGHLHARASKNRQQQTVKSCWGITSKGSKTALTSADCPRLTETGLGMAYWNTSTGLTCRMDPCCMGAAGRWYSSSEIDASFTLLCERESASHAIVRQLRFWFNVRCLTDQRQAAARRSEPNSRHSFTPRHSRTSPGMIPMTGPPASSDESSAGAASPHPPTNVQDSVSQQRQESMELSEHAPSRSRDSPW